MLKQIAKEPDKTKREQHLSADYIVRLENLEDDGADAIVGELVRCQNTNLPGAIDGNGLATLAVDRLGHSVVFRYNHKKGML